jgi:hypothetical protein
MGSNGFRSKRLSKKLARGECRGKPVNALHDGIPEKMRTHAFSSICFALLLAAGCFLSGPAKAEPEQAGSNGGDDAAMEARGSDMQEFEFELTDVFYPLLTKEESAELSQKMLENARISVFYKGEVKRINTSEWRKYALKHLRYVPKTETEERKRWEKPQSVALKDGKLRIKAAKKVEETLALPTYALEGTIDINTISISLPMEFLAKLLDEEIAYKNTEYAKFHIHLKDNSSLQAKGYEYATSEDLIPINNAAARINNPATNNDISGHYGMNFHAIGKLSLVKDGKTVSPDEKPPFISKTAKMNAIGSGIKLGRDDTISIDNIKGLPANLADARVRYLKNGKRFEQFALYANAKDNGAVLAGVFITQIKTHGKLQKIYVFVNDRNIGVSAARAACIFGFGINFHEDGEVRYFSEPKDDDSKTRDEFFVNSLHYSTEHEIKNGDITPLLEYENKNAAYLKDKPNSSAKTAACKELLSYAKHILSAPKEALEKEFDAQYKTIGAAYEKERKRFEGKSDGKGARVYPDGSIMTGFKTFERIITYPNGNIFKRHSTNSKGTLYFSKRFYCDGKFRDGKMMSGNIFYEDKNGNEFTYRGGFKDGVAEGELSHPVTIKTKALSVTISDYSYNKEYEKVFPIFKNGRLEGEAYATLWDNTNQRHELIKSHAVTFKNGKIVQHDGISEEILKTIAAWLEKLYAVKCDVNYTIKDK